MNIRIPDIKPCEYCGQIPVTKVFPSQLEKEKIFIRIECKNPECIVHPTMTYCCRALPIDGMIKAIERYINRWNAGFKTTYRIKPKE